MLIHYPCNKNSTGNHYKHSPSETICQSRDRSYHINLPKDFHAKRVELTIVALDNDTPHLSTFQQFLLDSSEMTDEEYRSIEEKRRHLQQ